MWEGQGLRDKGSHVLNSPLRVDSLVDTQTSSLMSAAFPPSPSFSLIAHIRAGLEVAYLGSGG